jgi:DNA-binding MarR family transcriptional regulator
VKPQRDESGRWLGGLSEPMRSMREFLTAHDELQRHQARRMGIHTTDVQTLRLLELHGPLGPTELARRLDLRSASVTVLLDRLEAAGSIERIQDDHDRRRVTVRALPHALEALFATWAPIVRAIDEVGHGLTPDEQRAVCSFLDRVTAVIERDGVGSSTESAAD